jgi:hypothetical protein
MGTWPYAELGSGENSLFRRTALASPLREISRKHSRPAFHVGLTQDQERDPARDTTFSRFSRGLRSRDLQFDKRASVPYMFISGCCSGSEWPPG